MGAREARVLAGQQRLSSSYDHLYCALLMRNSQAVTGLDLGNLGG